MRGPNLLLKEYSNAKWLGALWLDIFNRSRIYWRKNANPSLVAFVLPSFDDILVFVSFNNRNREQRKT